MRTWRNGGLQIAGAYDSTGQRVQKVAYLGANCHERIYVDPFEVYPKRRSGGTLLDERDTLHVMDGERRVCMFKTDTLTRTTRYGYQFDDHLGTVALECDEDGQVITYEEYPADDVVLDLTGNVFDPLTGEYLGSLTQGGGGP